MDIRLFLRDGYHMPLLGLGTANAEDVANCVLEAIRAGYRLIDTAYTYMNEDKVGEGIAKAIAEKIVTRSELFIVTKLPLIAMRAEDVEISFKCSLAALGLTYVDLYLVHAPTGMIRSSNVLDVFPKKPDGTWDFDYSTDLIAIWQAMETLVDNKVVRSIGLSNFNSKQIRKILAISRIPPSVLQVECNVFFQQKPLRNFCKENNVVFMSYSPLGAPGRRKVLLDHGMKPEDIDKLIPGIPDILNNPIVTLVAQKHRKTTAQVALKFLFQQNIIVIPKSSLFERIHENCELFHWELDDTDMTALDSLDKGRGGRTMNFVDFFNREYLAHPEEPFSEPF